MKPFNLEQAKAGKPVCTRDGRDARIVCFDVRHEDYEVAALIKDTLGQEDVETFTEEGWWTFDKRETAKDLFMKAEKKEGWINIYSNGNLSRIHLTRDDAINIAANNVVATIKIEWEE